MEEDPIPTFSPLSRQISRNGKTVRVDIYDDDEGGWLLEVVDEFNNSTVWNDPFPTDSAALEEALRVIEEEGIQSLIGAIPRESYH